MRALPYRGKSLKTGKWVFGYYAHRRIKNPTGLYTPNHCIFIPDINYGTDGGYWEEIDRSTLGQYVGTGDDNGERIFAPATSLKSKIFLTMNLSASLSLKTTTTTLSASLTRKGSGTHSKRRYNEVLLGTSTTTQTFYQ